MRIALDYRENVEKNAQRYFEKAKTAKRKLEGARRALRDKQDELESVREEDIELPSIEEQRQREREWYEKYHWFYSSDDMLVIGGRDASTNEYVVKKHAQKGDLVFHTDMSGSPFVVVKAEGESIGDKTVQEAAIFTLMYSSAWKEGLKTSRVFHVTPDQVSKEAKAGEYLEKGSFMIYGDTTYVDVELDCAIGRYDQKVMGGPRSAVEHHCDDWVAIQQGRNKTSDVAKQIQQRIGGDLDELIQTLPAGGVALRKV